MELLESIERDRATRSFTDDPVARSTILTLVDSARRAGSGHNRQPWTFVVLDDGADLQELASFGDHTTPLTNAPVGIVIVVDEAEGNKGRHNVFDCGRAAQNLMLTAVELGLGTVPQAISAKEEANRFLDLPPSKSVLIAIAVGHPAEDYSGEIEGEAKESKLSALGRKPVEEVVHWNGHE